MLFCTGPQINDFTPFELKSGDDAYITRRKNYINMKRDANQALQATSASARRLNSTFDE
ncbi:hypothetical protein VDG1235_3573 [Verrucomicrobiia bacterium DG1235]|nr:hypothetical protein VDG1235_3573 [Verrucomicrobiae bacterium DG1235]